MRVNLADLKADFPTMPHGSRMSHVVIPPSVAFFDVTVSRPRIFTQNEARNHRGWWKCSKFRRAERVLISVQS